MQCFMIVFATILHGPLYVLQSFLILPRFNEKLLIVKFFSPIGNSQGAVFVFGVFLVFAVRIIIRDSFAA